MRPVIQQIVKIEDESSHNGLGIELKIEFQKEKIFKLSIGMNIRHL